MGRQKQPRHEPKRESPEPDGFEPAVQRAAEQLDEVRHQIASNLGQEDRSWLQGLEPQMSWASMQAADALGPFSAFATEVSASLLECAGLLSLFPDSARMLANVGDALHAYGLHLQRENGPHSGHYAQTLAAVGALVHQLSDLG